MNERLEGTTLVVGSVSNIGSVVVDHLNRKTADLFLTWHEKEPTKHAEIPSLKIDLTNYDSISSLIKALSRHTPEWRNMVYIAGDYWADEGKPINNKEDWERAANLFQVNATAFTVLVRTLYECLEKQELTGSVVAISSTSADHGYTGAPIYGASKAALNRLVKDAASRYGKILSVSAVAPGPVDTPMLATTPRGGKEEYIKETPTGKLSTTQDIAKTVVYLLENPQINGAILAVDGGRIVG